MAVAEEIGVDYEVVLYIKDPPNQKTLMEMVNGLEDPVEDLVRKDSKFKKLELKPEDFVNKQERVEVIKDKNKQNKQTPENI